jgi:GntR family transcriptional regulator, transcriptional repressor for pyruvate dehydrogenase complex
VAGSGIKRVNLSDHIVRELAAQVRGGQLRPGDRLPSERELMQRFEVGRSTVREAIRAMAIAGLVESATRRGTVIVSTIGNRLKEDLDSSVMTWALRDLYELRRELEGFSAAMAATRATEDQLHAIATSHDRLRRKIERGQSYFSENADFHLSIARAAHNSALVFSLSSMINSFRESQERMDSLQSVPEEDLSDHEDVLVALQVRDPGRARDSMRRHLERTMARLEA